MFEPVVNWHVLSCAVRMRQPWLCLLTGNNDFPEGRLQVLHFHWVETGGKGNRDPRAIAFTTEEKIELKDDQFSGRPRTSVTELTTVRMRSIIDEDPAVTPRFLSLVSVKGVHMASCMNT